jgi:hypothetical protein
MLTISLSQLNAYFGVAMPIVVGLIAGLLRQDGFAPWLNELISHLVIVLLALTQTLLGGQWGGSGLANFLIVAALSYSVLATKFGSTLQGTIQTRTSVLKAPPPPPPLTLDSIAAVVGQQLQRYIQAQSVRVDQMPTQQIPIVRTNTPPIQGG